MSKLSSPSFSYLHNHQGDSYRNFDHCFDHYCYYHYYYYYLDPSQFTEEVKARFGEVILKQRIARTNENFDI